MFREVLMLNQLAEGRGEVGGGERGDWGGGGGMEVGVLDGVRGCGGTRRQRHNGLLTCPKLYLLTTGINSSVHGVE